MKTKTELEEKYDVVCYAQWRSVPAHLHPRSWYEKRGVKIPRSAKPDGVKGGGISRNVYFLFDERKWLSCEQLHALNVERRPVI